LQRIGHHAVTITAREPPSRAKHPTFNTGRPTPND
jgi:hypothetical protein